MRMRTKTITALLGAGLGLAIAAHGAETSRLTGAGSTAIYPVLSKWAAAYKERTGVEINYQPIGSGGGIAQIKAKTVDFAQSDKPLGPEELATAGLAQFPAVIIGVTPVLHVAGIDPGALTLDGGALAGLFLGKITKWNDPALAKLNPSLKLPDLAVTVVHRSDGSGTTFNFADYLSKVSPEWKQRVGAETSVKWPVGVGGKGNAGVAAYVQQVAGSIGYVEYAYAVENKMAYTKMVNRDGKVVGPSLEAFQAAAAGADYSKTKDFFLILTDQPGGASWPITAATYMLVRRDAPKETSRALVKFCEWTLADGQDQARKLEYVPLPEATVRLIKAYWHTELGL